MYVVLFEYSAPLEEVDYVLPDHAEWLARHYAKGHFIASGRQPSNDGHVILARAMPRGLLDAVLATDPFAMNHLVRHQVLEFRATRTAPGLCRINEALAG